ncbi:MAG TPA: hypothetical protein VL283_05555 [Candidatus Baltobacteraceae bacterium]|nr:hypothetical protein [Candidatus Baltobacteraceae bacterium]
MPLDLSALEETCSFLVPAYGVTRDVPAAADGIDLRLCIGPAQGAEETYGLLRRDDEYFLPRGTAHFMFGASALLNDAIGPAGERRIVRLREAIDPMPKGRSNTCLMVHGMRICARRHQDRHEFIHGYAAWEEHPGVRQWVSHVGMSAPEPVGYRGKSVTFGRTGRGALYAPVGDGKARILLLDFHVVDHDASAPDLLIVWSSCTEVRVGGIPHLDPCGERLSDAWNALIGQAIDGYRLEHGP